MYDFVTSCIGHLKNIGLLNYSIIQMLTYFTLKYKNIMSINKTTDLIRRSFKYWEDSKLMVTGTIFPIS